MHIRSIIVVFLFALLFSCGPSHLYDKQISVLDSTKIVLQVKINELKKIETNIEQRGFSKFEIYKKFLKSNVHDTISRIEASALQQFLNAGEIILIYNQGKADIIQQTEMSVAQLQKLSSDLKENNLPQNQALSYFDTEKDHAGKLVSVIERNINAVNISLVNFKTSLPRTEEYIKKVNNGQLPSVVADATVE